MAEDDWMSEDLNEVEVGRAEAGKITAGDLLKSGNILRWYRNLARGSPATADVYLKRLAKFCRDTGVSPERLLSMEEGELKDLVLDYITSLEGFSGSYAASFVKALKSWFEFHNTPFNAHIRIRDVHRTKVSEIERVPSRGELKKLLWTADLRARAIIALMAFAGVRLGVLGNYQGSDGLRVGDIPELRVEGRAELICTPATVIVRPSLSKAGHQYFTFLCKEGCEYLLDYLNMRLRRGERLMQLSPLISGRSSKSKEGEGFLRTASVSNAARRAIRNAGFDWRPYVLRHYFDTYMLMAEAAGIIPEDYRVFWMGHKGDIEHQYTTNKNRLPESLVEDMRLKYEKAAIFLQTGAKGEEEGYAEPRQKAVRPEEIDGYLESGWVYVATLPDGRVIIERNAQPKSKRALSPES